MAEEIKLCKLIIKGYDQFKDIELDFTDPKTGEPLEKICFIGRNGTGKSKLLRVINSCFVHQGPGSTSSTGNIISQYKIAGNSLYNIRPFGISSRFYCDVKIDQELNWQQDVFASPPKFHNHNSPNNNQISSSTSTLLNIGQQQFILTYCPPEDANNLLMMLGNVPVTTLEKALSSNQLNYHHQVSPSTVNNFWERLMFLIIPKLDRFTKCTDIA
jgi:energy-coupling factor transporter ATP-binding protein EcfA2